ncbi:MAG: SDR family NAD(P)-dependent oxidoreductase [Acidimicrobiales bacterium]
MGLSLEGAAVLVTGASSGIGAALAPLLAERGATVGLVARREDRLRAVLERCRVHADRSRMWVVDLSDPAAAERVALEAWDAFDGLDVVVNNAAVPKRRPVLDLSVGEIEAVMRTNFVSPVRLTLAVLPRMVERDRGVIVNVSSLGGRLGIAREAAYCASKFALCGWTESLALDLWDSSVDIRLVIPGPIETEIWDQPDNDPPLYDGPKEPPETVAAAIVDAIEGDRFEIYAPDLKAVAEFKTADIDTFLAGAAQLGAGA